jgi:hypothetical protein
MIYRGPGFLAVVWFTSWPTPSSPLPSVISTSDTQKDWKERQLADGRGGEGGQQGTESYNSINHSILSGFLV